MSRVESILKALINSEEPSRTDIPQSRVEYLLMQLAGSAGGGSLPIRILTDGEYSTLTGIPTISDPEENTLYLVPGDGSASNLFSEWIYVNNSWENIGRSSNTLKGSSLTLGQTTMTEQQLQNLLPLSSDSSSVEEPYGVLFPDTFWTKLTLINADVNNNDANNGALRLDRPYHIATESVLHFDHVLTVSTTDATLQVADRIYAADGTFISTNNWKRTIIIPANAYFRLVFRAQPDDQSVTLDITTSMAKVTFAMASALSDIKSTIAPDETDMTADANYAVNSFFIANGTLYRATAAIATGGAIIPGTNCVATTIADQLTYLYRATYDLPSATGVSF